MASILSKLLYVLHTTWLKTPELNRVEAFHAKCLRKIMGIPLSYISRVSNEEVLRAAGSSKLSGLLLQRQLMLFAHVARKPPEDPLRNTVFQPSSMNLCSLPTVCKKGRPRLTWAKEVQKHAIKVCEMSRFPLASLIHDDQSVAICWKRAVRQYCSNV